MTGGGDMSATDDVPTAVIRLEGTFDLPAARLLENSLRRMAGASRVRVDFTHVREFKDFAVAVLAQTLRSDGAVGVKMEGLGLHQVRLLRYFGVDPAVFRRDGASPAGP
jgi:anti-anti-sigma regulatory factor